MTDQPHPQPKPGRSAYGKDGKPYLRWWWFASRIENRDIDRQVDWISANGFGGVELSFVYPSNTREPVFPFLGPEWRTAVAHCAARCREAGIGFDVTFGSLWPFGGSMVDESDASQTFRGPSSQRLTRSWELGEGKEPARVINHLDRAALDRYTAVVSPALRPALDACSARADCPPVPAALFCDSWEIHPEGLWTEGFGDLYEAEYGYRVEPYMERLDEAPDVRYDYRRLVARLVLEEFYRPFTEVCHAAGALSRVQCHGAPTDLIAAYAAVDVPESETLLFDPPFSAFAASAAAQAGVPVVSCEAFTCLYGWLPWPGPGQHHGEEYWPDIRLTADAVFASGVNLVVWHGMPFRSSDRDARFYATVHVGPDAAFARELPGLNGYFAEVSRLLQEGRPYAPLAVYQPLEDVFRRDRLDEVHRRPSAEHHWEMHYVRFPEETRSYVPLWTSEYFLASARVRPDGSIELGAHRVRAVYVDSEFVHAGVLRHLVRLARDRACIVLARDPAEPGRQASPDYPALVRELAGLAVRRLADVPPGVLRPTVSGTDLPEFVAREIGGAAGPADGNGAGEPRLRLFFAHPASRRISYPLPYRYADSAGPASRDVTIAWRGAEHRLTLDFGPGEALLLEVAAPAGTARDDRARALEGDVKVTRTNDLLARHGLHVGADGAARASDAPGTRRATATMN